MLVRSLRLVTPRVVEPCGALGRAQSRALRSGVGPCSFWLLVG